MIEEQKKIIDDLIKKIESVSATIIAIDEVMSWNFVDLDEVTRNEIVGLCGMYEDLSEELVKKLRSYFEYEKENNMPTNFKYRYVYKRINS